ncbi:MULTISPECIES: DUF3301 domain-containing protein [Vibrio]|uniref:DUF3301 domain-containing protein n=2 Tax=Vibrio TaxID=662 RepID=A0A7X4LKH6_9VIBR|nr:MULTISPECIES: DUF3301 domain-containing protein [Vibrio]MBF8999737.1 DUF3301 domain-containing protein [Vibrio nitrifigilis]MZI93506.1 DUF3301 domain-containing protein [Vibrio eleionomae]
MNDYLLGILLVCLFSYAFWQQRRQAEIAKHVIKRQCDQLNLQLVSVSFGRHHLKTPQGEWRWHTVYWFEFSALGDDCYQGQLVMQGFRAQKFHLPPHHLP